ncbi:hypothetical protein [Kitasatospora sp. NPDC001175]|uniref:hypothetical protein n=1 Tax=Kitasatospora sp. NPDC001175 TaxID=3157103 RepID=UPI003D02BD9C
MSDEQVMPNAKGPAKVQTPTGLIPPSEVKPEDISQSDAKFAALVDEAKRALPGLTPTWTDHNVSDPGVTLIEAAAQQVDLLSYRLAQIPETDRQKLIALVKDAPEGSKTAQASEILVKLLE